MYRICLFSLVILTGACSSGSKDSKPSPASDISDDPNAQLVMGGSSADLICSQSNVFDTLWNRYEVDMSATTIAPEQIPADTEELSIWRSQVQDLSPVFGRKFKFLDISESKFNAWEQLAQFPELEAIAVGGSDMNAAEFFALKETLPQLKRLYIYKADFEGISLDFTAFPNLESISLSRVTISDLTPLAAGLAPVTSLKTLQLESLRIPSANGSSISLKPLMRLTQIKHLTANFGSFTDWESLNAMTFLTSLQVKGSTSGLQQQHIANLRDLETLDLSYTKWPSYDFSNQKTLKNLCLTSNKIKDLSTISPLSELETLDLSYNSIEDLSPLKDLGQLKNLVLVVRYKDDVKEGYNPIIQAEKRSPSNCPRDAKAKVLRDFCTPR